MTAQGRPALRNQAPGEAGGLLQEWSRLVYDRTRETWAWIETIRTLLPRVQRVHAYYNNHYAGYGVGSARLFQQLWEGRETAPPTPVQSVLLSEEP